jgi:hypothetical protein
MMDGRGGNRLVLGLWSGSFPITGFLVVIQLRRHVAFPSKSIFIFFGSKQWTERKGFPFSIETIDKQTKIFVEACPHVHAAFPCRKSMQYVHAVYPCCMSMLHVDAASPCRISMLYVHAACPCCMSLLHVYAASPCCMFMVLVLAA